MRTIAKLAGLMMLAAATAGAQASKSTTPKPSAKTQSSKVSKPAPAKYKKTLADSLARQTKVTETAAASTALASVPNGKIQSVNLEREGGKLIYSYDIKVPGKSGVEEVNVDALTGTIASSSHESAATEKKEAAAAKKADKPASKSTKPATKKPPV
jgi:uncharacterized membrane protein YkoI